METHTTHTTTVKTCRCGCEAPVQRRFLPGHDAKLKGRLINDTRSSSWWVREAAAAELIEMGWAHFIPSDALANVNVVRSRHAGRFVTTRHINAVGTANLDEADVTHSHRDCPAIEGTTVKAEVGAGWACSTCIHTHDTAEIVANTHRAVWVREDADVTFESEMVA